MGTINFKTSNTIAGGVGTPVTGDTINETERNIISALGGFPGSGATYDWPPHLPSGISEFRGSYDQGLGKFVGSMFAGLT